MIHLGRVCGQLSAVATMTTALWAASSEADVVCDTFDFKWKISDSTLELSLDTDLPDDTVLFVDVSRSYFEKGSRDEYAHNYFSEKSTVGEWRKIHRVSIGSEEWKASLRAQQKKQMFQVRAINEKQISISMVIPVVQPNPAFGDSNLKLTGKAVRVNEKPRVVTKEIAIDFHLDSKNGKVKPSSGPDPRSLPSFNPRALDIGATYEVSRETPLMPFHSPADPLDAVSKMKPIPEGSSIKILERFNKKGNPWYKVVARGRDQKPLGTGWVNSNALLGQDLEPAK